jgi:hypothetical protein
MRQTFILIRTTHININETKQREKKRIGPSQKKTKIRL